MLNLNKCTKIKPKPKPILTCNNCSRVCAYHCAQLSYTKSTEWFWQFSLLSSRQSSLFRWCLLEGTGLHMRELYYVSQRQLQPAKNVHHIDCVCSVNNSPWSFHAWHHAQHTEVSSSEILDVLLRTVQLLDTATAEISASHKYISWKIFITILIKTLPCDKKQYASLTSVA